MYDQVKRALAARENLRSVNASNGHPTGGWTGNRPGTWKRPGTWDWHQRMSAAVKEEHEAFTALQQAADEWVSRHRAEAAATPPTVILSAEEMQTARRCVAYVAKLTSTEFDTLGAHAWLKRYPG